MVNSFYKDVPNLKRKRKASCGHSICTGISGTVRRVRELLFENLSQTSLNTELKVSSVCLPVTLKIH